MNCEALLRRKKPNTRRTRKEKGSLARDPVTIMDVRKLIEQVQSGPDTLFLLESLADDIALHEAEFGKRVQFSDFTTLGRALKPLFSTFVRRSAHNLCVHTSIRFIPFLFTYTRRLPIKYARTI